MSEIALVHFKLSILPSETNGMGWPTENSARDAFVEM